MAVFEQYITGDDADASTFGDNWFAQTFTPTTNHSCVGVNMLFSVGTNPGKLTCSLRATDSSGLPTGADLVSGTIPAVDMNSVISDAWIEVGFGSGFNLIALTTYAIVIRALDGASVNNDINWRYDSSSPIYAGGSKINSTDAGVGWTADTSGDFMFQERSGAQIEQHLQGDNSGNNSIDGANWGSQAFTTPTAYTIYGIALKGERGDANIGTITVSLRAVDINDEPTGADLASGTFDGSELGSTQTWFDVVFTSRVALSTATTYALVVRCSTSDPSDFEWSTTNADTYQRATSVDSGASWTGTTDGYLFKTYSGALEYPSTDLVATKKLVTVGNNEVWYESVPGTLTVLSDSIGQLNTTVAVTLAEGFGKAFIANGTNLKIVDFQNSKINTTSLGANPPDPGTVLTGGTSGAAMVVDYITALTGNTDVYGFRTTTATFSSGETVTGTDDDSNAISFTTSAVETAAPHWYDWTVFGNDSSFGTMPDNAILTTRYRGRLVLSGNTNYPHQWYMSKVASPFEWLYGVNDPLSAVAGNNADAGEVGDYVRAMIPFGDDFLIFGCANSIHLLDGDPVSGGSIDEVGEITGITSYNAWCKDSSGSLYFWGQEGLYKMKSGRTKPINIGQALLPKWSDDWAINPSFHRVNLAFDRRRNGIVVSKTTLTDGTNLNYWYSLKSEGLYPETYPTQCGIYCSFDYKANNANFARLLLGCNDGYVREFLDTAKSDDSGDSDTAISSHFNTSPLPLADSFDHEGKLKQIVIESSGGASGGSYGDTDSFSYNVHVGDDAEILAEDVLDSATSNLTGTISGTGRKSRIRSKVRGMYWTIRLFNSTISETWVINRIMIDKTTVGRFK